MSMIPHEVPACETYEFEQKRSDYCICVFVVDEGEKLLRQLEAMAGICRGLIDIVIADGGSTDGSTEHERLKQLGVNTLLVKTGPGKLGSQMRMAFDWALRRGYAGVVTVDGNGKDGMDAIPRFVEELKNGIDHVQGSRFIPGGHHENTPKSRLLGLKLLHVPLIRLASGFKYTDTTNGFRAYSAKLLSSEEIAIFRNCFSGYELHYYLAIEAARRGFACREIPVSRVYPAAGKVPTKISGMKGNLTVVRKLVLSSIGFYRRTECFRWKKAVRILFGTIALLLILNILAYFGLALGLSCSGRALVVSSVRPMNDKSRIVVLSGDENGKEKRRILFHFNMGKNRIFGFLIGKDDPGRIDLRIDSDRKLYCNDIVIFGPFFSNRRIDQSNIGESPGAEERASARMVDIEGGNRSVFSFGLNDARPFDGPVFGALASLILFELLSVVAFWLGCILFAMICRKLFRIDDGLMPDPVPVPNGNAGRYLRYFAISIVLSLAMTLILFPGIIYSDSITRTFDGRFIASYWAFITTTQSIVSILLYSLSIQWLGNVAFVSIVQSFLLFFSICLVCDKVSKFNKTAIILALCLCPFVLGISVYHETNVNALIFFLLSFWFMFEPRYGSGDKLKFLIVSLLTLLSLAVMFNYRPNAVSLVPAFLLVATMNLFVLKYSFRRIVFAVQVLTVFLAVLLSARFTDEFVWNSFDFSQPGFLWKGVSVLQNIPDNRYFETYFDCYSEVQDATVKAVENNRNESFYGMIDYFPTHMCLKENTFSLLGDLLYLSVTQPKAVSLVLQENFLRLSGSPPLLFAEYNYNRWSDGEYFGIPLNASMRKAFFRRYCSFASASGFVLIPWILFVSSMLLTLFLSFSKRGRDFLKNNLPAISALFFSAVSYNYAYLLNAQSYEYRYWIPGAVILLILNLLLISSLVNLIFRNHPRAVSAVFTAVLVLLLSFQLYSLACENGKSVLAECESEGGPQIVPWNERGLRIFHERDRVYFVLDKHYDDDVRVDLAFVPDTVSSVEPVTMSFELSRLPSLFTGVCSGSRVFYYDFLRFPVKSFVIDPAREDAALVITDKPSCVHFDPPMSPWGDSAESTQIYRNGLTFDRRGIFVFTNGTDFAGRYLRLRSGRKIRIVSGKWYQEGKILYLEDEIHPDELDSSACELAIEDEE